MFVRMNQLKDPPNRSGVERQRAWPSQSTLKAFKLVSKSCYFESRRIWIIGGALVPARPAYRMEIFLRIEHLPAVATSARRHAPLPSPARWRALMRDAGGVELNSREFFIWVALPRPIFFVVIWASFRRRNKRHYFLNSPQTHVGRNFYGFGKFARFDPFIPTGFFHGDQGWNGRFGFGISNNLLQTKESNCREGGHFRFSWFVLDRENLVLSNHGRAEFGIKKSE